MDFIDHRSTANFKFSLSATDEKLRIKSDGNVGIGVSNPSTKLEVDGVITTAGLTTTADINFGDNDKAIFGAGSDLQIYHSGTHSYIKDSGTGNLNILASTSINLLNGDSSDYMARFNDNGSNQFFYDGSQKLVTTSTGIDVTGTVVADGIESSGNFAFTAADGMQISAKETVGINIDSDDNDSSRAFTVTSGSSGSLENLIIASEDAGVTLYHDNAAKLATTSTGIDVTGTATMDGLDVQGNVIINNSYAYQIGGDSANSSVVGKMHNSSGMFTLASLDSRHMKLTTSNADRLKVDANGDISFYEDTGTTAKLFWDASAEALGIGTSSPSKTLDIEGNIRAKNTAGSSGAEIDITSGGTWRFRSNPTTGTNSYGLDIVKGSAGTDVKVSINSAGNVGIGTSSPTSVQGFAKVLKLEDSSNASIVVSGGSHEAEYAVSSSGGWFGTSTNIPQRFATNNAERMRIDASGNVGIGTSSPSNKLDIKGTVGFEATNSTNKWLAYTYTDNTLRLNYNGSGADEITIDSSGNVGIGTDSPSSGLSSSNTNLTISDADGSDIKLTRNTGQSLAVGVTNSNSGNIWGANLSNLLFSVASSEVARFDSSGNLLVGTTDTTFNTAGTVLYGANGVQMVRSNATPLNLNRTTSDGAIQEFYKDGAEVGSIGVSGGNNLYISGQAVNHAGLTFATDSVLPTRQGTITNNITDLGQNGNSFKDLHLSGTAYVATSIGIGTSSPSANLEITQSGNNVGLLVAGGGYNYTAKFESSDAEANIIIEDSNSTNDGNMIGVVTNDMYFITNTSERMRIDSSGNVGIGTSSPVTFGANTHGLTINGTGHYQHLTLQNNGNSDFSLYTNGPNGTIINQESADPLHFNTDGTERMRIDASGNLLVGKTSADNTTQGIRMLGSSGFMSVVRSNDNLVVLNRIDGDGSLMEFRTNGTTRGSISISGSTTSYNTSSDQRLKDNIVDAPSASDDIDAIQVRSFDWKADGSHQKYGMVAQELQSVAPEAVSGDATEEDMMGVDYSKLVPMMLKEIQSLRARVAQLEGAN